MPIYIDPVTRQRILFDKRSYDIQYDLTGDTAISQEDVPVVGNWEDWTGSATVNSRAQQMFAGTSNELFGTDPAIEHGAKVGQLTDTGDNAQTTRPRTIKRRVKVYERNKDKSC